MSITPLALVILSVAIIVVLLLGLWLIVPILSGLPYRPTPPRRIRRALELAGILPGEQVYDLGAGDGRILLMAAQEFGARATGIEISPLHCLVTWLRIRLRQLNDRVRIRWGNFYTADLASADVVIAYVTSQEAVRLRPHLEQQLHPGARVVAIASEVEGWQPSAFDNESLIFLYRMPPQPGNLSSFLVQQAGVAETYPASNEKEKS